MTDDETGSERSLRRQARILVLLNAAAEASLAPVRVVPLHALAYLANVLAPVWDMPALDGKILKRKGGPFYPALQRDLDRMVGKGMVVVRGVTHARGPDRRWRIEGNYCLNPHLTRAALGYILRRRRESRVASFVQEIAYALSALGESDLDNALVEDATYADPTFSEDNVVDFDEWTRRNPSANAAAYFDHFLPRGTRATPGERLHLYVRHLHRRIHAD
jgi:hypothetical protein